MSSDLYQRIRAELDHYPPGLTDDTAANALLEAYDTHPGVRAIIDASPYNSRADVIDRRVTADALEQVLRLLAEHK